MSIRLVNDGVTALRRQLAQNVKDFGALGDGQYVADAAMTSGSAVLTSASGPFTSADVGKIVQVQGAGAAGIFLTTTIASYESATQVTLATTASATVSGQNAYWATDDTDAFNDFIDALTPRDAGYVPPGLYGVSSTLVMPYGAPPKGHTIEWDDVSLLSSVGGPAIDMNEGVQFRGRLIILCGLKANSYGVRFLGDGQGCRHASIERLEIFYPAAHGVLFRSESNDGVYYNDIGYLQVRYGSSHGVKFETIDGANQCNANRVDFASIQNCGGSAVVVDGADGNTFGYLEAESNTSWGIDLVDCVGFFVLSGWLEGNTAGQTRLADYPTVKGVIDILTQSDGSLATTVTQTYSADRSVRIGRGNDKNYMLGSVGAASLYIGANATAAADQDLSSARLNVASLMAGYRRSSSEKTFTLVLVGGSGGDPSGYRILNEGGVVILRVSEATGLEVRGTVKSVSGGLDLAVNAANNNVRVLTSGTGKLTTTGGIGMETHASGTMRPGRDVTASRPSASTVGAGAMFYDTTLSKPIWSDGTNWKDADGNAV